MKLYVYTKKRSLPRLALKGLPEGAELDHASRLPLTLDAMYGDDEPGDPSVLLEIDADGLEPALEVDGEWAYHLLDAGDVKEEDFNEWTDLERTAELFGFMVTNEVIPPNRITVLGQLRPDFGEADVPFDGPPEETLSAAFPAKPTPLKAFKQPFVTRLLRSIFLPQHKLYGSGRKAVLGVRLVRVSA